MSKKLTKIIITSAALISFTTTPYFIPNSYAEGITGGTTRGSKEDPNWRNRSSENSPQWEKWGRKFIDKINPYSVLIEGAEKFGEQYNKFKKRSGNITGTGRTTEK